MMVDLFRYGTPLMQLYHRSSVDRVLRWMRHPLREQVLFAGGRVPNLYKEYNFKVLLGPGLEPETFQPNRSALPL